MKLVRRNCACGCGLWFRVLATAPHDSNHIYASRRCRGKSEGHRFRFVPLGHTTKRYTDEEVARYERFHRRVAELLDAGSYTHWEIVETLNAEGTLTPKGKAANLWSVRNCAVKIRDKRKAGK